MWTTLKQFYNSSEWENFRRILIAERIKENGMVCEECGEHIMNPRDAILHHEEELTLANVNDYDISLNPEKIRLICFRCHNKEHSRFGYGNKHLAKRHNGIYIVYGAPLSGKTSYVRENMERGDIVVDMDMLFQAVSYFPLYDKPDNLKMNVLALRNSLLDNIKTRYGTFNSAWIIGGYAKKFDRERLAGSIGSELVFIEADKEECYRRLDTCGDYRQHNKAEWRGYIDKWFEDFMP